jgi:hypothetical protein
LLKTDPRSLISLYDSRIIDSIHTKHNVELSNKLLEPAIFTGKPDLHKKNKIKILPSLEYSYSWHPERWQKEQIMNDNSMVSVYCTHGKEQTSQFVCRQKKHAGENFVTISEVNYGEHQSRQIKIGSSQGQWSSVMSWYSLRLTKFFAAGESPILVSSCWSVCLYYVNIYQIISGYNWNLCIPDWLPATWTSRSNDWKRAWGNGEIVLSQMVSTWPHTWRSPHGHIHGGSAATPWDRLNRKNQWMSEREKGEIQPQNRIHGRSVVHNIPPYRDGEIEVMVVL